MTRIIRMGLLLSALTFALFAFPSAGSSEDRGPGTSATLFTRVFLSNRTMGSDSVVGGCAESEDVTVRPGEVQSCQTRMPNRFRVGIAGAKKTFELDVSQEGEFTQTIQTSSGCREILGSKQTAKGGNARQYFVSVWKIRECGKEKE